MGDRMFEQFTGTDLATAEWLAGELNGEWRFDHTAGQWHHWNGVRWAPDDTEQIKHAAGVAAAAALTDPHRTISSDDRKAITKLMSMSPQSHVLEALATLPGYGTNGDDWDATPWLLGCENGVVDLRTNTLDEHPSPDLLVTKSTDCKFKPVTGPAEFEKRAPHFMRVMRDWMSGDDDMVAFLIFWFGASLFGFSPEQRFLLMTGIGRNGKGSLKHAVLEAAGDYAAELDASLYMRNRFGVARSNEARADLLKLKGLRIAFFSEPQGGQFNEELLKGHTGGDRITARALYSNNLQSWDATHSITFLTNDLPEIEDVGPSMGERVMVADFRNSYEGDRQDRRLYQKLTSEKAGILAILVWAASVWYQRWENDAGGLILPARVTEQSKAFMERGDTVANWLNERCERGRTLTCPSRVAFESYRDWFEETDAPDDPMSEVKWATTLLKKGMTKAKTERGMKWTGFRLLGAMELAGPVIDEDEEP